VECKIVGEDAVGFVMEKTLHPIAVCLWVASSWPQNGNKRKTTNDKRPCYGVNPERDEVVIELLRKKHPDSAHC